MKQVDFDGEFLYSPTIHYLFTQQSNGESFSIYPNPILDDDFNLAYSNVVDEIFLIQMMDMQQNEIFQEDVNLSGSGILPINIKTQTSPGVYFIKLISSKGVMMKKIFVN
ncbi:MAG: Secretion system C-terminal sorting domain [Bacteroidota bacterium]